MTHLIAIRLLGSFSLAWRGREVPLPAGHTRDLAGLLALNAPRPQSRAAVAATLWGECDAAAARRRLRIALWRLKRSLDGVGADVDLVVSTHQQLRLLCGPQVWIDAVELTRLLDHGHPRSLQAAVELYRGDLLEDCFDDWCEAPRRALRERFQTALLTLMELAVAGGDLRAAIAWGHRLLQHDALLEDVHRELMRCYHALGDRGAALRQFESCRHILGAELQVEPMAETLELFRQIRGGATVASRAFPAPPAPPISPKGDAVAAEVVRVREELDSLALLVKRARARLDRLLDRIDAGEGRVAFESDETRGRH